MRPSRTPIALALATLPLLLLGCSGSDDGAPEATGPADVEAQPTDDATPAERPSGTGSGAVTTDAGVYRFEPATCTIYEGELEIAGPGTAPDGTPVHVDLSAGDGYANLRIDIGTNDPFVSSDEILTTVELIDDLDYQVSGSTITGTASLADGTGTATRVQATVDVDCG